MRVLFTTQPGQKQSHTLFLNEQCETKGTREGRREEMRGGGMEIIQKGNREGGREG